MAKGDTTPGQLYGVAHDIIIDGTAAFSSGEQVKIEKIDPNLDRPEYKYVVFSQNLQKYLQLSDADLVQSPPPDMPPSTSPAMPPAGAKGRRNRDDSGRGLSTRGRVLVIGALIVIIIIAIAAVIVLKGSKSEDTATKPNTPSTTAVPVKTADNFITLEIRNGQQVSAGPAAIRGVVKSDCTLTLNGQPVPVDPATKKFDVVVNINEGPNTLTFNIKETSTGKTYVKSVPVTGVLSP